MQHERLELTGDPAALAAAIRALVPAPESVQAMVAEIVDAVRSRGDAAVAEYTRRFDTDTVKPLRVEAAELADAAELLDPAVRQALKRAAENVRRTAEVALTSERTVKFDTHRVSVREAPVARAAVYVPGGRAPYPSTVVMGVVTARAAGVPEIVVTAPPGQAGEIDPVILGACGLTAATAAYRMGGAQAVAALAHGTESVDPVDVIVGPGNLYVQEAKRQVSAHTGIDGFAGPSDLLVIAAAGADPDPLALDLLAQAEHGPGTLVVAVSTDESVLSTLARHLIDAPETGATARTVAASTMDQALEFAQAFAPEHIQLVGADAEALAPRITRAGCVFVGPNAGTAFGDYVAGPNHIIPTSGAARFASALSPAHFRRRFAEVRIDDPGTLARAAAPLARAEGFELHARSMEARIRDND
jgi:histidinol dehydrogenase